MVNYQNGKVFLLKSKNFDKVYIGSTCEKYLSQVLARMTHVFNEYKKNPTEDNYKDYFDIINKGDCLICLISNFSCSNKSELENECNRYINLNPNCINNPKIKLTLNERYHKYYKEQSKIKYQENKIEICEKAKQYYDQHKDTILQKQKVYKKNHRLAIKKAQKEKDIVNLFIELPFHEI